MRLQETMLGHGRLQGAFGISGDSRGPCGVAGHLRRPHMTVEVCNDPRFATGDTTRAVRYRRGLRGEAEGIGGHGWPRGPRVAMGNLIVKISVTFIGNVVLPTTSRA
jgi:hypothetical protein